MPDPEFLDETYCLDWDETTIVQPTGLFTLLGSLGINLADWPILLTPTAVDYPGGEIWMISGTALQNTCNQNTTIETTDLTATTPGSWNDPDFEIGPVEAVLAAGVLSSTIHDAMFTGTFSSDLSQIVDGTLDGQLDVSAIFGACVLLPCTTCSTGSGDCVVLEATDAVYNATGTGPVVQVP